MISWWEFLLMLGLAFFAAAHLPYNPPATNGRVGWGWPYFLITVSVILFAIAAVLIVLKVGA